MNITDIGLPIEEIRKCILNLRGEKVMLDEHLAILYGVETRALVQAVKRNIERFPPDFTFQLTAEELQILRSQTVTSSWDDRRYLIPLTLSIDLQPPMTLLIFFT